MTTNHHEYDYDFIPPSEAPVFSPKPEEFKDALAYFDKIRFVNFKANFKGVYCRSRLPGRFAYLFLEIVLIFPVLKTISWVHFKKKYIYY